MTSLFPSGKVKFSCAISFAEWSGFVGLLILLSKMGTSASPGPSSWVHLPFWGRCECKEERNVPGVLLIKLTALAFRIIRFQRQKKKKKARQDDILCTDQMMMNWVVIWDSFTRKGLKGFHMNRIIRVRMPGSVPTTVSLTCSRLRIYDWLNSFSNATERLYSVELIAKQSSLLQMENGILKSTEGKKHGFPHHSSAVLVPWVLCMRSKHLWPYLGPGSMWDFVLVVADEYLQ